ncbi:hypothetical protein P6B95_41880 [Streptomyces atratus]|nr:hypothetical protein [Streptomyces atratus]WPW33259.1 hypothetical protein P6B95_41880 [Streptomyces atratus]
MVVVRAEDPGETDSALRIIHAAVCIDHLGVFAQELERALSQ